jgi:hypothetical protein
MGPLQQMEAEMRSAENAVDIRPLSDGELNDVSGAYAALIIAAAALAAECIIGFSGPNVGTIQQQAAALGMSHLL